MKNPSRRIPLALCAAALFASCATGDRSAAKGAPAAPAPPPAAAQAQAQDAAPPAAGFDSSSLPEPARRELEAVLSDEFCYCGCPHTLGACLAEHGGCRHAKRMAALAARQAADGAPSTEIINALSRHYLSFRERRELSPDPLLCKGPKDAPITVVEFSDFECPYCGAAAPILDAFVAGRPDARLCYLPFPLPGHPNAVPAAQAALLARDLGKFWPMHDALFAHQRQLSRERILELGVEVGLPRARLEKALEPGAYAKELQAFREAGRKVNLRSTPTVFVNGRQHALGIGAVELAHSADDELEWARNGGAWAED